MREILFRGKRKDNGEWVCSGNLIQFFDNNTREVYISQYGERCNAVHDIDTDNIETITCKNGARFYKVIPETVGQYTGLYDSTKWEELTTEEQAYFLYPANGGKHSKEEWNGKPIFEEDIVNFKTTAYHFKKCRIKYQVCYARYCAIDNTGYEYPMDKIFEYKVIGNIHDNPELLERG